MNHNSQSQTDWSVKPINKGYYILFVLTTQIASQTFVKIYISKVIIYVQPLVQTKLSAKLDMRDKTLNHESQNCGLSCQYNRSPDINNAYFAR